MRSWLPVVLSLLFVSLFTGSARADDRLRVGHDPWIGYAGAFVARDEGYFADEGLDVDMIPYAGPGDTLAPLAAGRIDVAFTTIHHLARMVGRGHDELVAIYLIDTSDGADAVVARAGIRTPAGLRGCRIGVRLNDIDHMLLRAALERGGLERDDVDLIDMSPDAAAAALMSGRIDAAVTRGHWIAQARAAGARVVFSSAQTPDLIVNAVVVRRTSLETRRDALAKLLSGLERGRVFLQTHAREGRAHVARWLHTRPANVDEMLAGDRLFSPEDNRVLVGSHESPGPVLASFRHAVDFVVDRGYATDPIRAAALFSTALIRPAVSRPVPQSVQAADDTAAYGALHRVTVR